MKKTLAAVLAAAMALSTATVALAKDEKVEEIGFGTGSFTTEAIEKNAKMGDTTNYLITKVVTEDGDEISGVDISKAMKDGDLTASVVVTSNQSKLDGRPSITAGKTVTTAKDAEEVVTYKWNIPFNGTMEGAPIKAKVGDEVKRIYLTSTNGFAGNEDGSGATAYADKGDAAFKAAMTAFEGDPLFANYFTKVVSSKVVGTKTEGEGVRLSFKINHTYGVDDVTVKMKLRFTAKHDVDEGSLVLPKGDTLTSVEVAFKAGYNELSNYYEDMQLTKTEVSNNNVILNGSALYEKIGDSKFTITFGDDIAMFEGKSSAAQKKINLYYNTNEISAVQEKYPDIDFTYLTFVGNPVPSFQNTGKLYFAAEDKEYTVYEWDGEYLTPVSDPTSFDKTYKTVTVKNVKRLGSYVISPVILPEDEEPEEPAEPVDSTPVAEPDDEGENPNTGAC